jgi:prepilin-type N-terminal cleavage/methylation domain-containing protein
MYRRANGFTLMEVIVAILIGVVLTSIAVKGFGLTSSEMSVKQAKNVFTGLVARARAMAIERGTLSLLWVDVQADSVNLSVWTGSDWDHEETVHFGGDMGIDIQSSSGTFYQMMTPRGYANTRYVSFSGSNKVTFVQGGQSESLELLPLGQVR